MIAIVTLLSAFPLGYLMHSRLAASTTYAVAYLWAFTFQTLYLLLDFLGGGEDPAFTVDTFPTSYGVVAVAILLAGIGLVNLGHWVRGRVGEASRSTGQGVARLD